MDRSPAMFVLLLMAAAIWSFSLIADAGKLQPSCIGRERDALLAFKQGINDTDGYFGSWQQERQDCCQWAGITCSNTTGHVIELELGNTYLVGQISPSSLLDFLGSLKNLRYLDPSNIYFNNTAMVLTDISWLTRLPMLLYLDMSNINLSSVSNWPLVLNMLPSLELLRLPHCSLSSADQSLTHLNLTDLQYIYLNDNYFSHPIASSWFWNITSIKYLGLTGNYLYGPIPDALANMASLQWLDLGYMGNNATMTVDLKNLCDLEGLQLDGSLSSRNITDFQDILPRCPSNRLHFLSLSRNNMAGILANKMGHLTNLSWFDLSYNKITGFIPLGIGNLSRIENLLLSNNFLTGAIPLGIGNLSFLQDLYLSNNLLTGAIPLALGSCNNNLAIEIRLSNNNLSGPIQLGIQSCPGLYYLDLSYNSITGHVPSEIGLLGNMIELDLSNNKLDGEITKEHLVALNKLEHLDLSHNSLSGHLPSEFGANRVVELTLSSNYFTGHIPECVCMLRNLLVLDLSNNLLVGELPRCSRKPNLVFLILSHNSFSGKIQSSLKNYSSLAFIDLSANNFHGTLPSWIGDLAYLRFLQLSHNSLCGDIPMTITNLKRLRQLSLAGNSISGVIPWSLSNLTAMAQKHPKRPGIDMFHWYTGHVGKFREVWPIVMKRQELKYGIGVFDVVSMDLSLNHLIGEIPDGITSLNGLLNLNFSCNQLSGKIPGKIGDMKSLESLDLSRNKLSGEIPTSLSDLTYLSSLDLSYNNLTGRIPLGSQLDTLYLENPSVYTGNIGLCGPPIERNCPGNNSPKHDNQQKVEMVSEPVLFFYFGLGSGFVAGLWVVFCALLFKKRWRIAYFRLFDKLYDNAYVFLVVTWGKINHKEITS